MVIFYCIFYQTSLKIQTQCFLLFSVIQSHYKTYENKRPGSAITTSQPKQMLDATLRNYIEIFLLKSRIEKREVNLNVKTGFHMSTKHNKRIDRTQKTNEEDGRQRSWEERKSIDAEIRRSCIKG